jgi:hypothetical protein
MHRQQQQQQQQQFETARENGSTAYGAVNQGQSVEQ